MTSRRRFWCFTWFNPPEPEQYRYPKGVLYASWQLERCPDTQRLHWQGYIELESARTLSYFVKYYKGIHAVPKYETSTREQARAYSRKEDTRVAGPWEYGEFSASEEVKEKVSDRVARLITEGSSFEELCAIAPGWCLLHQRSIFDMMARLHLMRPKPELPAFLPTTWNLELPICDDKRRHFWIWSAEPSVGKTHNANIWLDTYGGLRYNVNESFQNPTRQRLIVIDEYNQGELGFSQLNQMCDGNFQFPVKGQPSFIIRKPIVIVLSNYPMASLYKKEKALILLRSRFVEIKIELSEDIEPMESTPHETTPLSPGTQQLMHRLKCSESPVTQSEDGWEEGPGSYDDAEIDNSSDDYPLPSLYIRKEQ